MHAQVTRRTCLIAGLATCAFPVRAVPRSYTLMAAQSRVRFHFEVNGTRQTGEIPVTRADIVVDTQNFPASTAAVTADVTRARTGFAPMTQALRSASVLDAGSHPVTRFVSRRVQTGTRGRLSEGAVVTGDLTLRGVTRTIRFDARLSRPAGSAPDDLRLLYIDLVAQISRSAFGAGGYAGLVADAVDLDIHAEIRAQG